MARLLLLACSLPPRHFGCRLLLQLFLPAKPAHRATHRSLPTPRTCDASSHSSSRMVPCPQFLADQYAKENDSSTPVSGKKRKEAEPASSHDEAPKKRGRPKGSKNKPKET
eukprot:scaffold4221_cov105-Isochrysis_galbana.AAC.2